MSHKEDEAVEGHLGCVLGELAVRLEHNSHFRKQTLDQLIHFKRNKTTFKSATSFPVWTFLELDLLKAQVDVIVGSYAACVYSLLIPALHLAGWRVCSRSRRSRLSVWICMVATGAR